MCVLGLVTYKKLSMISGRGWTRFLFHQRQLGSCRSMGLRELRWFYVITLPSPLHVYVCGVHVYVCMCMCVCLWRLGAMSEVFSNHSPSLHRGRVSQLSLEFTDIVSPACSRNPLSLFSWCWNYRQVAVPPWHLCGCSGSELRSSCLNTKHFIYWPISPVPITAFSVSKEPILFSFTPPPYKSITIPDHWPSRSVYLLHITQAGDYPLLLSVWPFITQYAVKLAILPGKHWKQPESEAWGTR